MKKKTFLLSAKEPKVEVNFSQGLKVTMKILHKHLKWNIETTDQKGYPKTPPHPTSNLLKSSSCLCFLAKIILKAYSYISVLYFLYTPRIGTPSLSSTCVCLCYRSLAVLCLLSLNTPLRLCT